MRLFRGMMGEFTFRNEKFKGLAIDTVTVVSENGKIYDFTTEAMLNELDLSPCQMGVKGAALDMLAKAYWVFNDCRKEEVQLNCEDSEAAVIMKSMFDYLRTGVLPKQLDITADQRKRLKAELDRLQKDCRYGRLDVEYAFAFERACYSRTSFGFGFTHLDYTHFLPDGSARKHSFVRTERDGTFSVRSGKDSRQFQDVITSGLNAMNMYKQIKKVTPTAIIYEGDWYQTMGVAGYSDTLYVEIEAELALTRRTIEPIIKVLQSYSTLV